MILRNLKCNLAALLVGCACVLAGTPANAITLSVTGSAGAANTPDFTDSSPPVAQNLTVINSLGGGGTTPDVLAAVLSGGSRYRGVVTADSDALNFAAISRDSTSVHHVVISVTPDNPLNVYTLTINTSRLGALVIRNEGGASGDADTSAVTGLLNGVGNAGLNLADPGGSINQNNTTVIQINQANSLVLAGLTGTQNFTLDFTWTNHTSSGNNVINGGDEGVVLLGLQGTVSQVGAADDYPGTSGRANGLTTDGHFVNVSVEITQIVPEPSSILLGSLGGFALGVVAWRRRRR